MAHGLRVLMLSLCIASAITLKANAQQAPAANNVNSAQIQKLQEELKGLRQEIGPLISKMQQLMGQTQILRDQIHHLQEKMRTDLQQITALRGGH